MFKKLLPMVILGMFIAACTCSANELYDELLSILRSNSTQYNMDEFVKLHTGELVEGTAYVCSVEKKLSQESRETFTVRLNDGYDNSSTFCEMRLRFDFSPNAKEMVEMLKEKQKVHFSGHLDNIKSGVVDLSGEVDIAPVE
ncbi:MAG: hypothetical protein HQL28_01850 [Candidatus Omnitrophica bacterium]|nr:hypothetical protein [Candidatus Omnitrophota bacterium]